MHHVAEQQGTVRGDSGSADGALRLSLLGTWALAFLFPSSPLLVFDGLPLSSRIELVALGLMAGVLAYRPARQLFGRAVCAMRGRVGWVALCIGAGLMLTKALMLIAVGSTGSFAGCYSNPVRPIPERQCERSYEDLPAGGDRTRLDRVINFGPTPRRGGQTQLAHGTNWNLGWVNSVRLNNPSIGDREVERERLPFSVTWTGRVSTNRGWLPIEYVGEGAIKVGEARVSLPPSYERPKRVFVAVAEGRQDLNLRFRFDDGHELGETPPGPFATIRVFQAQEDRSSEAQGLLEAVSPALGWRMLGFLVDFSFGIAVIVAAAALVLSLRRAWRVIAGTAAVGAVAVLLNRGGGGFSAAYLPLSPEIAALGLLLVVLAYRRPDLLAPLGVMASVVMSTLLVLRMFDTIDLDPVLYRTSGNDVLTYQGYGRTIFEAGSLRAGEDTFYYMPGYRYLAFVQHVLFGEGDIIPAIFWLSIFSASVFFLVRFALDRMAEDRSARLLIATAGVGLILMVTSRPVKVHTVFGLAEVAVWAVFLLILPLWLGGRQGRLRQVLGAASLGVAVTCRPNVLIPAILLVACYVWLLRREQGRALRASLIPAGVFVVVASMPLVHNLYYGGRAVPFTTGPGVVVEIEPQELPLALVDHEVAGKLRDQMALVTYLDEDAERSGDLASGILILQVSWVAAVVWWWHRRDKNLSTVAIAAWPLATTAHAAVFDVATYYPRHIIATYIAAAAATMYMAAIGSHTERDGRVFRDRRLMDRSSQENGPSNADKRATGYTQPARAALKPSAAGAPPS